MNLSYLHRVRDWLQQTGPQRRATYPDAFTRFLERAVPGFRAAERVTLTGSPFYDVMPPAPRLPLPARRARTFALSACSDFIASLPFERPGDVSEVSEKEQRSIPVRLRRKDIYLEWPDSNVNLTYPSAVWLPSRGTYDVWGIGPARLIERSVDVFGRNTALLLIADWTETFQLEVWGGKDNEREAVLGGIETTFLAQEDSSGLRLVLTEYFNQVCSFELGDGMNIDDPDVVRGRRRAHLSLKLTVPVVKLIRTVPFYPTTQGRLVQADGESVPIGLDADAG